MVETRKATVAGAVGGACYWVLDKIVDYALARIKPGELYGWLQWAASVMALVPDWVVGVFVAVCAVLSIWPGLIRRPSTGWKGAFRSTSTRENQTDRALDGDVENEVALIASGQSPIKNHAAVPLLDAVKEAHGKTKSLAGGILSWRHVLSKLEFEVSEGRFHACQIVADARDGHIKLLGRRRRRDGSETPLRGEVHPEACDPGHVIETRDGFEIKVAGLDVAAYIDLALERPDVDKHVKRLLAAGVTK